MKNLFVSLIVSLLASFTFNATAADAPDLKYGLYIFFEIDTFRQPGEKGQLPVERFAPTSVDVKSWAHAAKEAGMTFAVLTAKHESGFCLWGSTDYEYDAAHSPFNGDIIAAFIAACKAEGILPGLHYSIPDVYNEGFRRFQGSVTPPYFKVIKQHITELATKYPELRLLVLNVSERLSPGQLDESNQIVKRLNPQCAVWNTTGGDQGPHHAAVAVIRSWTWSPNAKLNPAQQLFNNYQQCQAAGKALLLSVGPDPSGNIPDDQIAVLTQMKNLIANPPPAISASPSPEAKPAAADRLKQVKSLYDQGLINKEDYDKKVKEIMDSL